MAAPTTIAVAELKGILKMLQDSRPNLKVEASHEMENVRELLLWSRPLFSDNFVRGLDVKVHELRDGIKWISSLKLPDDGSVATAAFKSARSCLCDALVNIVYALNVG